MTREEFQQINGDLKAKRLELVDIEEQIRLKEKELLSWEQNQMADICDTLDTETGKPKFSNAEKRAAELAMRQTGSGDWAEIDEALSSLRRQAAKIKIDSSFLNNDIQYGINHASNEIEEHLQQISAQIETVSSAAAYNAVRRVMADLFQKATERGEEENSKLPE